MENTKKYKIGIKAEQFNKWERRASLIPKHVRILLLQHPDLEIYVEKSDKRIFANRKYEAAGAILCTDISHVDLILGVKQVPVDKLIPEKSYMFFSHTMKAQAENMEMLDKILEKKIRLMDYEKITNDKGARLVAFGRFAGTCGTIDILSGYGKYLLNKGISTPFQNITQSFHYFNCQHAKESISRIGKICEYEGFPEEMCPIIFGVTSRGRCAQGVMEIQDLLPIQNVDPDDLEAILADAKNPIHRNVIYVATFDQQHLAEHKEGQPFDKEQYYQKPSEFRSIFSKKYQKYISVLFHAMYWDSRFPTIITASEIEDLQRNGELRLMGVADITCDFAGSIDFMEKITTIEEPYFVYKPIGRELCDEWRDVKDGVLYCSIENQPTQFPEDASSHFSDQLHKFLYQVASSNVLAPLEEANLPPAIHRACITNNGELTQNFEYIDKLRKRKDSWAKRPNFLDVDTMDNNVKKLVRSASFVTFKLNGHLFDTKAINEVMDVLMDEYKLQVNLENWEVGRGQDQNTSVLINVQGDTEAESSIVYAQEKVSEVAKKHSVEYQLF